VLKVEAMKVIQGTVVEDQSNDRDGCRAGT